jgi:mRNA interferase MazF
VANIAKRADGHWRARYRDAHGKGARTPFQPKDRRPELARGARHSEIWTVPDGPGYAGKPRPAVIIQDDRFDTNSVTTCPFTTDRIDAPLFRLSIEPRESNGLTAESRLMIDKITTVRRSKLGDQIGILDDADVVRLNRALVLFLGIAGSG